MQVACDEQAFEARPAGFPSLAPGTEYMIIWSIDEPERRMHQSWP